MDKNKDLIELLDLLLDAGKAGVAIAKDPKNLAADMGILLQLLPEVGPAFENVGAVPAELAALSAEDAAALVAHVGAKLAVADAHAAGIVDASLKVALSLYGLYKAVSAPAVSA